MYRQVLDPVSGSLALSAAIAVLPILTLFVLLGALRLAAWMAALGGLAVALLVAVVAYSMPADQALLAATEGAAFGLFPLAWTFVTAIWIYAMTVDSGHFDLLSRSFGQFSDDRRIQAVIIAFCFGSLLEGIAGQGTPVAITSVMLLAAGFAPLRAVLVALVANTVPAAFGPLGLPITTLAKVTGLPVDDLGSMAGRQVPVIAVLIPLLVVWMTDGRRGVAETWRIALGAGLVYGLTQFVTSNYLSMPLADILAGLVSAAAVVAVSGRGTAAVTRPVTAGTEPVTAGGDHLPTVAGSAPVGGGPVATVEGPMGDAAPARLSARELWPAYLPYAAIVAIFAVSQIPAVKDLLESATTVVDWPGLHLTTPSGKESTLPQFKLNPLSATGTLLLLAGLVTMIALRIPPGRAARTYLATIGRLRWTIATVASMLALSFVMNASAQTATLGTWLAGAGTAFALLSPLLGWVGVAVTGSDTSANSLFGALQVSAAEKAGLDPVLLAAANASGGVVGKMISLQNLSIGAAAVGMAGQEGAIFAKTLRWSIVLIALMCLLVGLQATPVLSWMVP